MLLPALLGLGFFASELGLAASRRASRAPSAGRADGGSIRVLWLTISLAVTLGVLLALYGPVGPRVPYRVGVVTGVLLFAAGSALRWWSIRHLGRFFTVDVAVARDQRVVDDGPYRLVRHPSYSGLLLQFAGLALTLGSVLSLVVVLVPTFLALVYRMRVEERALLAGLGAPYAEYMVRTKRLVPLVF